MDVKEKYLERLQYRATHTLNEYNDRYDHSPNNLLSTYVRYCEYLKEYEVVKDLSLPDVRLINFIKDYSYYCGRSVSIYIEGVGFGYFDNPYYFYDYYTVLDDYYMGDELGFLIKQSGSDCNYCKLNELDIDKTLSKFDDCYEYIVFCEDKAEDSKVYTVDSYSFDESTGLVYNTDDSLRSIYNNYKNYEKYEVLVLDIHQ